MFHNVIFCLEILSTYVTRILIPYDYPCGKKVLDNVYSCNVPDSANGSSQNNAGTSLICCQALDRPAWNSFSEEQRWHPTILIFFTAIKTRFDVGLNRLWMNKHAVDEETEGKKHAVVHCQNMWSQIVPVASVWPFSPYKKKPDKCEAPQRSRIFCSVKGQVCSRGLLDPVKSGDTPLSVNLKYSKDSILTVLPCQGTDSWNNL